MAFLQALKAACAVCDMHKGAAICFVKQYRGGPIESIITARVPLPSETVKAQERCLTSYLAFVNHLLKRY